MNAVAPSRARITGWGTALPDKVVTNADLEDSLDTSDAWIVERTGIRERRVGGTTTGLGIEAAQRAMARAGVRGADIDLVLLCTSTPDETMPASASAIQQALEVRRRSRRPQRRLLRVRLRAGGRRRLPARRARPSAADRLRDHVAHRRLGGPLARRSSSATVPARWCSSEARAQAACSGSTSAPTARCATSSTPTTAARSRWTGPRCSGGPCGSWSSRPSGRWPTPASPPTTCALFVPHQANSRIITVGLRPARDRRGPHGEHPRDHRQHLGGLDPDGAGRGRRRRSARPRRPRAAHRLRRRHVVGLRRDRMGGMSDLVAAHRPRHRGQPGHRPRPAPAPSRRPATASR